MEDETLPDVEGDIKAFLRASAAVTALVANRVYLALPKETTFPAIAVFRVGGGDDTSEAPIDEALVQIDVYGNTDGGRAAATATKNAVRRAFRTVRSRTPAGSGYLLGATLLSDVYTPDPADARPRYALTYQVWATAA